MTDNLTYRRQIKSTDVQAIEKIIKSSGVFTNAEIEVALELPEERLAKGTISSYEFLFAEDEEHILGYTCFGLIPMTFASYDIYWIAIDNRLRGGGLGKKLMAKSEEIIKSLKGSRIYVETSSRTQYNQTHNFYESCGYHKESILKDFYAAGDSKIIYLKKL
jgi:ribosomal protein S18 acetylase RimI-like enzyme